VASLSLATTESWKNGDGERQERTEWHRVVAFGAEAFIDMVGQRGRKGALCLVEGKLQTRKFTNRDGVEQSITEVVVDRMGTLRFPEARDQSEPRHQDGPNERAATRKASPRQRAEADAKVDAWTDSALNDEIPF
jgi:single-strand DNA-binding protein